MASASCTLHADGAVTTVPVSTKVKVRYEFDTTATSSSLALPYAVSIDDKVLPEYTQRARALGPKRCIELTVNPGSRIALFLNSDAMPRFRQHPVYLVTAGRNDTVVCIEEKKKLHPKLRPDVGQPVATCGKDGKVTDVYKTSLTGDIWMLISHRYTWDEAKAMLPSDLQEPIRRFLQRLYSGLGSTMMPLDFPANGDIPAMLMTVRVEPSSNVSDNVSNCQLENGILPRTHPAAYVALLSAAYSARITSLTITSGWRPMLGSIAHRAGLGLDVACIGSSNQKIDLDRKSLKGASTSDNDRNVSSKERNLYEDYQRAKADYKARKIERDRAVKLVKNNRDVSQAATLTKAADQEIELTGAAKLNTEKSKQNWDKERNATEPALVRNFRNALTTHPMVSQLLDPWYLDLNTRDNVDPAPNEQISIIECLHDNHLHITVMEASLP